MQRKSETNWCKSPVLSSFLIFYLGCFRKTSVKFFTPWYLATLKDNIETVLSNESNTTISDTDNRLAELQLELVKLASSKADYEKIGN